MHEVSIAEEIKEIVIEKLKEHKAKKIKKIALKIGKLTSVVPDALLFAFEIISKNTPLENAKIDIDIIEIKAKCQNCKKTFSLNDIEYLCPFCNKTNLEMISGRELIIQSIEMEE